MTIPTTLGSLSTSPATTTSAKLWRTWRRTRTATWSRLDQRRQTAVHPARGNSNARTTSWTTSSGISHDLRWVRQARSDVCAMQTRGEDLAATYWCNDATSFAIARETTSTCPCLTCTGRRSMRTVCTPSSLRNKAMVNSSSVHFNSCLEQNIKNTLDMWNRPFCAGRVCCWEPSQGTSFPTPKAIF